MSEVRLGYTLAEINSAEQINNARQTIKDLSYRQNIFGAKAPMYELFIHCTTGTYNTSYKYLNQSNFIILETFF